MRPIALTILIGLAIFPLLTGCGGGNDTPTNLPNTGRIAFTVYWLQPARSANTQLVDANINSIRISISDAGVQLIDKTLNRPTDGSTSTTQVFPNLPPKTFTVATNTYAAVNATGTPVSTTSYDIPVTVNTTASVSIGPGNAVDHLEIIADQTTLAANATEAVTVRAFDPKQSTLLLSINALQWQSSNPAVATVTSTNTGATITAVNMGEAVITVTDPDSGKTATKTITVPGGDLHLGVN